MSPIVRMPTKTEQLQIRVTPREKATLKRRARAVNQDVSSYVLARTLQPARDTFDAVLGALAGGAKSSFALAELNDLLTGLSRGELRSALDGVNPSALSPFLQNYIGAMVELAAHRVGGRPPDWVSKIAPLEKPWFATELPGLRLHLLRASPTPFKRRNIFIDSSLGSRV